MSARIEEISAEERERIEPFLLSFKLNGDLEQVYRLRQGHLHDTFVATWTGEEERLLHQRINTVAFPKTKEMLLNNKSVVDTISRHSTNPFPATVELVQTDLGDTFLEKQGEFWRTYRYVEGSETHDLCPSIAHARALGAASAQFIYLLSSLPSTSLCVHQPYFQDTDARMSQLKAAWDKGVGERKEKSESLYHEIESVLDEAAVVSRAYEAGDLPVRVIHFDTKINNFLFRKDSSEVLCVIDLDLCMPGTALYDYGDLVRSAASSGREDETDRSKITVDPEIVKAVGEGFLSVEELELSKNEKKLLFTAPLAISFNLATRFLADYLASDQYFPVTRPDHNLHRAEAQWIVTDKFRALSNGVS